jgi:hypothetical protein
MPEIRNKDRQGFRDKNVRRDEPIVFRVPEGVILTPVSHHDSKDSRHFQNQNLEVELVALRVFLPVGDGKFTCGQ